MLRQRAEGSPRLNRTTAGILLLMLGVSLFAVSDGVTKMLVADMPVLQVLWARFAFFFVAMLVVLGPRRWASVARTDRPWLQLGRAFLTTLTSLLVVAGLRYLSLADMTAILFTMPLFMTALSIPLLGERIPPLAWVAILAGLAGALIVIRPGTGAIAWAGLLPLGTALFTALYNILARVLRTANPLTMLFYTELVGATLTTAMLPFVWHQPGWSGLALMAVAGTLHGLGHLSLILAFARAPASTLAPFGYVQLLAAVLFGLIVFGAVPDRATLLGSAVIVAAGLAAAWIRARPAPPS